MPGAALWAHAAATPVSALAPQKWHTRSHGLDRPVLEGRLSKSGFLKWNERVP